MNLTLQRNDRYFSYVLPSEVAGKHWIYDIGPKGSKRKIAAIEARDGHWVLLPFGKTELSLSNASQEPLVLSKSTSLITLLLPDGAKAKLLVEPPRCVGRTFTKLGFTSNSAISIGSDPNNLLYYNSPDVLPYHATLFLENERFSIQSTSPEGLVYVNKHAVLPNNKVTLSFGDVVFIMGLKITIGSRFIGLNNPNGAVKLVSQPNQVLYSEQTFAPTDEPFEEGEADFFYRSPRIKREIETEDIKVEAPPAKERHEEVPILVRVGPSIAMAFASCMMMAFMAVNLSTGNSSNPLGMFRLIPIGAMALAMILGAVLWPNLSRRYERRKKETQESKRKAAYASYLDKIRIKIQKDIALQSDVLEENRISVHECLSRAYRQDRSLFERTPLHSDFLELRVGKGNTPILTEVKFPEDKLTIEEDQLTDLVNALAKQPLELTDVPLTISLVENYVAGIVGSPDEYYPFMRGIITQVCTLHSPDEVKLVFLGDEEHEHEWNFVRALPHLFDSSYSSRFLATNHSEISEITLRLEREIQERKESNSGKPEDFSVYYLVIAASKELISTADVLKSLNELRMNKGFSVLTFAESIQDLPKECTTIIELDNEHGSLYDPRDASGDRLKFNVDINIGIDEAGLFSQALAAVKLEQENAHSSLPKSLSFLDMFEAGKVEHLNIKTRWQDSNPMLSLAAPLGVDVMGELSQLDIHENFHGPHGLVAGMTGSGKSEVIITYILSMATNYRPDEVSFVLIDYKGGGLVGAFDNETVHLPHLAGTITNLDGAAIQRSLVSINSELRRRQDSFNQAREIAGESTMDIYKYQALYRENKVKNPIPHLVIVSDEFAELKSQEPEFMDELISAARIGRSLGVHLILATQKPSGVVNDQIWSNSKFKICLKVADESDSREMLKRKDAAELVDAGRYFLQVGYNEFFTMGQSAYSGASYSPKEEFVPQKDNSLVLINNNGHQLLAAKPQVQRLSSKKAPEARVVLTHIADTAKEMGLEAPALWIEPLAAHITIDEITQRYKYSSKPYILRPLVGEYDDPANQRQDLLTLPLSENGNTIIFGATGTGVETALNTILLSMIEWHGAEELNAYLIDLGAETLGVFQAAPQVGDVLFAGDSDKIVRLFAMLQKMIAERKAILATSGLSFNAYNTQCATHGDAQAQTKRSSKANAKGSSFSSSNTPIPNVVVVLNDILAFYDLFPKLEDQLNILTREANRYGIYFIITASHYNATHMRLRTNFKQSLVLQFNDPSDNSAVFGYTRGLPAPNGYGRGLVKIDTVLEYQLAFANNVEETEAQAIQKKIAAIASTKEEQSEMPLAKAPSIPVLPEKVAITHLAATVITTPKIPFALDEKSIEPAYLNFEDSPFACCYFNKTKTGSAFIEPFARLLKDHQNYYDVAFVDLGGLMNSETSQDLDIVRDDVAAFELLDALTNVDVVRDKPAFVLVTGLIGLISRLGIAEATKLRDNFRALKPPSRKRNEGNVVIFIADCVDTKYSSEQWFKSQIGNKNGLWVGDGLSAQSLYSTNYVAGRNVDPLVKGDRGYNIIDGEYSCVKYLSVST